MLFCTFLYMPIVSYKFSVAPVTSINHTFEQAKKSCLREQGKVYFLLLFLCPKVAQVRSFCKCGTLVSQVAANNGIVA